MDKPKKFIDFIITQKCTYSCPYCSQSKSKAKICNEASDEVIESFFNFLNTIDKEYEITITGGEAILHPKFFEIIDRIKKLGFKINLITNLSFNIKTYQRVFDLLSDSLNIYDISFHLNQIQNFDLMLEKLEKFLQLKPQHTKVTFFIPLYLTNVKKLRRIDKILDIAKKYNINYSFQKIRFLNKYKNDIQNKYASKNIGNYSFARLCHAGSLSAVIYEDGSVYRCYSSRFTKSNYLGNIKNLNFKLNNCPIACSKKICTCPKPLAYNQILDDFDKKEAIKQQIVNALYLPKMLIIKKDVLIQKIRHYFDFNLF